MLQALLGGFLSWVQKSWPARIVRQQIWPQAFSVPALMTARLESGADFLINLVSNTPNGVLGCKGVASTRESSTIIYTRVHLGFLSSAMIDARRFASSSDIYISTQAAVARQLKAVVLSQAQMSGQDTRGLRRLPLKSIR
jgi:hypothetical protein